MHRYHNVQTPENTKYSFSNKRLAVLKALRAANKNVPHGYDRRTNLKNLIGHICQRVERTSGARDMISSLSIFSASSDRSLDRSLELRYYFRGSIFDLPVTSGIVCEIRRVAEMIEERSTTPTTASQRSP